LWGGRGGVEGALRYDLGGKGGSKNLPSGGESVDCNYERHSLREQGCENGVHEL